MMVDSHCHLDGKVFDADRDAVIERAVDAGVKRMLAIGTGDGPPDLEAAIRLADRYDVFLATVGVHPHEAAKYDDSTSVRLAELLRHPNVVALGEIGLDYHYDFSPRDAQKRVFVEQMNIAREAGDADHHSHTRGVGRYIHLARGALGANRVGRCHALLHRVAGGA